MSNDLSEISGPFGPAPRKSLGAILNAAYRVERIPLHVVESFQVGNGSITVNEKEVGKYAWFEGIDVPLFMLTDKEFRPYSQHHLYRDKDNQVKVKFRLSLCCHMTAALEISGNLATPELHRFLNGMFTNNTQDPCYNLQQAAGAFFQGGSNAPDGKWFLIEFYMPRGAQKFVDYLNEHYDPKLS